MSSTSPIAIAVEHLLAEERAKAWREAAQLTRTHRTVILEIGGGHQESLTTAIALFHLAKEMDEKAAEAARGEP